MTIFVVVLLTGGVFQHWRDGRMTAETVGSVIDIRETSHTDDDGNTTTEYQAILAYTAEGTRYTVGGPSASSPHWTIGETYDVSYDPSNPKRADVAGNAREMSLVPFGLAGVLTAVMLVVSLLAAARRNSTPVHSAPRLP